MAHESSNARMNNYVPAACNLDIGKLCTTTAEAADQSSCAILLTLIVA